MTSPASTGTESRRGSSKTYQISSFVMRLARPPLSTLRACAVYAVRRCVLTCRGSGKKVPRARAVGSWPTSNGGPRTAAVVTRTGPQMVPDGGGGDVCVRVVRAVPCFLPSAGLRRHYRLERACSSTAHCLQRSAKGGYAVACSAPAIVARGGACVHGWVTPNHPDACI